MKTLLLAISLLGSLTAYAGCESSFVEGGHTALLLEDAQQGAMEEAADNCPSGRADLQAMECTELLLDTDEGPQVGMRCVQQAICHLCDDNLSRKYEAMD